MTIKIFNPKKKPYGILSNNAYFPIQIDKKKYKSVTHYIYSNLLCSGTYQILVRNQKNALMAFQTYNNVKFECTKLQIQEALNIVYNYKIKNDSILKELLLKTKQKNLIYQSENKILGMSEGKGLNLVGKTLEKIRYKLLSDDNEIKRKDKLKRKDEVIYKIFMVVDALDNLMKIENNNLKEFENMTYDDILNDGNLLDKQYLSKEVIIENYRKGRLQNRNIIEMVLKYPDTKQISNIFRKYNLRNLYENLKRQKENLIFNFYLKDLILKNYPALPKEQLNKALDQQLQKLDIKKLNELRHDINIKFNNGKLTIKDENILMSKINNIDKKIPTLDEVEETEKYVFDPVFEMNKINNNIEFEEEKNMQNEQIPNMSKKQTQIEMFLENLEVNDDQDIIDNIDIVEDLSDETFENETEIVFDKNTEGKYGILSPTYVSWMLLNGLYYPTITHYLYAISFKNIISKLKGKKNPWILAHNLITLNNIDEKKYTLEKNIDFYVDLNTFNWRQIDNILLCEAKKKLFENIATIKFSYIEMQQLLVLTKNQQIIYNDKQDKCLGIGHLENGDNYTGKWLEKKRKEISDEIHKDAKENADIILLSQMLDNDQKLNTWIFERTRDLIHTLILLTKTNIDENLVDFVIDKLYYPCNSMEISKVYIEVPSSFGKRLMDFISFYKSEYSLDPKIQISRDAVSKIWKYVSLLSYNLLRQSNKAGEMPYIFLNEAQDGLSSDCKLESIKCIISAVQNINQILEGLDNIPELKIENIIGGILNGRPLTIVKSKQKNIKEFKNVKLSDLCYTILKKTRQQDGYRIINRVNFFKSLKPIFITSNDDDEEIIFKDINQNQKQNVEDALKFLEEM